MKNFFGFFENFSKENFREIEMADIDIFGDDPIEKPTGDNTQAEQQEKGQFCTVLCISLYSQLSL